MLAGMSASAAGYEAGKQAAMRYVLHSIMLIYINGALVSSQINVSMSHSAVISRLLPTWLQDCSICIRVYMPSYAARN